MGGDVRDQHRGGRARDPGHAVVLGEPEAAEPEPLRVAGQIHGVAEGARGVAALDDRGEVEHRERNRDQMSRFFTYLAFFSMNWRRGSTSSPISSSNSLEAIAASSMRTCITVRTSGSIVVFQS